MEFIRWIRVDSRLDPLRVSVASVVGFGQLAAAETASAVSFCLFTRYSSANTATSAAVGTATTAPVTPASDPP